MERRIYYSAPDTAIIIPPPDPDPPDPVTGFIEHAPTLAARNARAAAHGIGTSQEGSFTGFASLDGFVDVDCANATAVVTAMNGAALTAKLRLLCNWNGVSNPTTSVVNGPSNTALTSAGLANGAIDIGYNRPAQSILIVPGTGFTPIFGAEAGYSLSANGLNFLEIKNVQFNGIVEYGQSVGRPLLASVAYDGLTQNNVTFRTRHCRSVHAINHKMQGESVHLSSGAQFLRVWFPEIVGKTRSSDAFALAGYAETYKAGWTAEHWFAGVIIHNMVYDTPSANHFDAMQAGIGTELPEFLGYNALYEFCMMNMDCNASQGIFYAALRAGDTLNAVVHNCVILGNAWAGIHMHDPEGNGMCYAYRNIVARAPRGFAPDGFVGSYLASGDTRLRIICSNRAGTSGSGSFDIRENYTGSVLSIGATSPVVQTNTELISAQVASDGQAISQLTKLTGDGSWGVGFYLYNTCDVIESTTVRATSFIEIAAWAMPTGGWRAGNSGPVNPATWPANAAAIPLVMT